MKVDMVADIEVDMVADIEVDIVTDKVADININMEIEFYEIFRPEAIPACASSNFASSLDAQASLALTPVRPY